jgi:transcriptional regulator with XRE-family HTH domain
VTDHAYGNDGRAGVTLDGVSSRIAKARHDAGLTQRDLARRLGTSVWAIDELERGRRDPRAFISRIESATAKPSGWLHVGPDRRVEPPTTTPETDATHLLTGAQRFDRNLVLAIFVAILTVRFFTESIAILPSAGNFIDVLLLPIIVLTAVVRPAARLGAQLSPYVLPAIVFIGICAASVALNTSRVEPAPALLFLYGFLGPLAFFYASYRLWPSGQSLVMSQTIVALGVLQFVVICIFDLPTFVESGNPDDIVGTFGGNAYQLVFFLLVFAALVAGISTFEPNRLAARLAPVLFGATFLVIFLAQYRALLVSTALTILLIGFVLGPARGRGFLIGAIVATAFIGALGYVATEYPAFKFAPTITAVRDDPASFLTARLEPGRDVIALYGDNPRFITTGSGPGTYSSRAWRTFAEVGDPSGSEGAAQPYAAALSGGRAYHSDVADRYVVPRLERGAVVLGSHALTSPFSSYLALLAEVGVIGFVLMVGIYVRGLLAAGRLALASGGSARGLDPLPALALATTVAFFLLIQMAFLENWWEVARVTIPSWMLLAVCIREAQERGVRRPL